MPLDDTKNEYAVKSVQLPTILEDWKKAVAKLDTDEVMQNYAQDASLKGTMVDDRVQGAKNVRPYFADHFLKGKKSLSCTFNEINHVFAQKQGFNQYNGKYTFMVEDDDGKKSKVIAHFEFSTRFDKKKKKDLILSHGSYLVKAVSV